MEEEGEYVEKSKTEGDLTAGGVEVHRLDEEDEEDDEEMEELRKEVQVALGDGDPGERSAKKAKLASYVREKVKRKRG